MHLPPAKLTNGQPYTGHQQHRGKGAMRYCECCQGHRAMGPGWRKHGTGMACASCVAQLDKAAPTSTPQPTKPARPTATPATAPRLHAWQQPGYRFSIDWPPGFTPAMATPTPLERGWARTAAAASAANANRLTETIIQGRA